MSTEVYVSITGLQVRHFWYLPIFWRHALRAMMQVRSAPGNMSAQARTINGVHHTLSVWKDRQSMLTYLSAGAHREAMRVFPRIATGKTVGFQTQEVPDWSQVHAIWIERGQSV